MEKTDQESSELSMEEPALPAIDPQKQIKARQYARIKRRLGAGEMLFNLLYLLVWLVSGWALSLREFLSGYLASPWLLIPVFVFCFGLPLTLVSTPLAYYSGFILPRRFGLSHQSLKDWLVDELKGGLVGAVMGVFILEMLYYFLRLSPSVWWVWAAGFMLVFSVLLSNLAPVLLMPLFNKFTPLGEEHHDLEQRLLTLGQKTGAHVKGVYKFDLSRQTTAANAALTGMGNSRRIILGDTLINEFTIDEVENVMAHELAHHVHGDIPQGIAFGSILTVMEFYCASLVLNWGIQTFGFENVADIAAFPLFLLVIGIFSFGIMPLQNAYSRWRERKADRYALQLVQKPAAFISAFTRLANQNLSEIDPERWVVLLLHSHPPIQERIKIAEEYL